MSAPGIGNLSTLIKRLEAATSRLEDIAVQQHQHQTTKGDSNGSGPGAVAVPGIVEGNASVEVPASVEAWEEAVHPKLQAYSDLSDKIGGNVQQQAKHVIASFDAVKHVIFVAGTSKKPSGSPSAPSPVFMKLLEPVQSALAQVIDVKDKNRSDRAMFNHLSAVAEGIPAIGWITVEPKPGPYVEEMKNAGQFYFNRVIKEFKDSDKTHVEWSRSFTAILDAMKAYIMQHHTTGLSWNPKGGDAESASSATSGPPPPPPPPGPPAAPAPPPAPSAAAGGSATAGGMDAVFSQINKGEGVTGGLRKVDPSQMTHKNPDLRSAAPPAASSKPAPPKPGSKPGSLKSKKPAKTALEGNKWSVEYHEGNRSIVIEETSIGQTVNVFGCKDSIVHVKGKVNAIQMVSCTKTSILLDTLVSSLELTSSPSFTVQVTGSVPTILIDSCDSGQVYLSEQSLGAEIVTAKSSAINISIPKPGSTDGEYVEIALPEQLRHQITPGGKGIKSEVVEHSG
jgi:adenylyl cyclase-associated protein